MISIHVVGKLYQDSEVKQGSNGEYLQFSIGVRDDRGDEGRMMYFDVNTKQVGLAGYLKSQKQVLVRGDLKSREYNGKTYFSIRSPSITLLGGNDFPDAKNRNSSMSEAANSDSHRNLEDEIPF